MQHIELWQGKKKKKNHSIFIHLLAFGLPYQINSLTYRPEIQTCSIEEG